MMKRLVAAGLGLLLALAPLSALAMEDLEEIRPDEGLPEAVSVAAIDSSAIPAKSAILIDQQSGQVLYEQNADEKLPPASVTKVMTLLLVMEAIEGGRISLTDMVSVSENANSMGGSQIWLKVGETMSVDDLLKAVSIASANDASVALAEHVAGTEDAFIDMMNNRAYELGMENTHFVNCTGLDADGHLTTARDIALMSRELIVHPLIRDYSTIWMDSLRGGETELVNTNKLVRFYDGATGLKTGTTSGAGSCLSATATRGELSLVAVVMGCDTSDDRFASARGLLDYGFASYTSVTPPSIEGDLKPVKVLRGVEESVTVTYEAPGSFLVDKGLEDAVTQNITLVEDVEAPVVAGQVLGKAEVLVDGRLITQYDLKAAGDVERMTWTKAFAKLLLAVVDVGPRPTAAPDAVEEIARDPGASGEEEAVPPKPCSCGVDTCYCEDIGDICGCTKTEE